MAIPLALWMLWLTAPLLPAQEKVKDLWMQIKPSVAEVRIQKRVGDPGGADAFRQILLNGTLVDARFVPTVIKRFESQAVSNPSAGYAVAYLGFHWNWISQDLKDRQVQFEIVRPDGQISPASLVGVDQKSGIAVLKLQNSTILSSPPVAKESPSKGSLECYPVSLDAREPLGKRVLLEKAPEGMESEFLLSKESHPSQGQLLFTGDGAFWGFVTGREQPSEKDTRIMAISFERTAANIQNIILTGKDVPSGWIGVYLENDADPQNSYRALVTQVTPESPAFLAGLHPGDRLMEIDGKAVNSAQAFSSRIRWTDPGSKSRLALLRNGRKISLPILISERRPSVSSDFDPRRYYLQFSPEEAMSGAANVTLAEVAPTGLPPQIQSLMNRKPVLGIVGDDLTPQLGEFFGAKGGRGVLISSVMKGSLADKSGMKAGDVLISLNGLEIENQLGFAVILDGQENAPQWLFRLIRDRKSMEIRIFRNPPR